MLKKMLKVMVALGIFGFILSAGEGAVCEAAQWKKARKTQEKVYDVSGFTGLWRCRKVLLYRCGVKAALRVYWTIYLWKSVRGFSW